MNENRQWYASTQSLLPPTLEETPIVVPLMSFGEGTCPLKRAPLLVLDQHHHWPGWDDGILTTDIPHLPMTSFLEGTNTS